MHLLQMFNRSYQAPVSLLLRFSCIALYITNCVLAHEIDLHYHVKFKIAVADSWTWEEALTIASAVQGVDENKETVAALEINPIGGKLEQSPKSFRYHCFSMTKDKKNVRNRDVLDNLNELEANANMLIDDAKASGNAADQTNALIAIGVYLHCQEDSWSHSGFGGEADGHAAESLRDTIAFRSNPDHPGARPKSAENALRETLEKLSSFMERLKGQKTDIVDGDLDLLIKAVTHPSSKRLTDNLRRQCNQDLAEHWLYLLLKAKDKLEKVPEENIQRFKPSNESSVPFGPSCKTIHDAVFTGQHEEKKVLNPKPVFPKLRLDGTPKRVAPDGSYDTVALGVFDLDLERALASRTNTDSSGLLCDYRLSWQVSNIGPNPSPPANLTAAILPRGGPFGGAPFGDAITIQGLSTSETIEGDDLIRGPCVVDFGLLANLQPISRNTEWDDRAIGNDRVLAQITDGIYFAQFGSGDGFRSDIVLVNPASTGDPVRAEVVLLDRDGFPLNIELTGEGNTSLMIPPSGSITLSTDGSGELKLGSAAVFSEKPLEGVIRFSIEGVGSTGVASSRPLDAAIAPARFVPGGVRTGLAIRNIEDRAITVGLSLKRDGEEIASTSLELAPGASMGRFLEEIFGFALSDIGLFVGELLISSDGEGFTAIALELDPNTSTFITLPVTPLR